MGKFKKLIFNGIIMTLTTLLLRWVGVMFNTYISNRLGSEGMGIYSLVQSVFGFAVTFACSGINLGATRLISEALALGRDREIKISVKKCIMYSLVFSLTAFIGLFSCAGFIGTKLLGDARTVKSVKILAFSLPFISLSSVLNGYFSAVRKVYKSAIVMIFENFIQISVTVKILSLFSSKGVEYACVSVAIGTLTAEILSLLYNFIMYVFDIKKRKNDIYDISPNLTKKLLKISLPLALSAYARSGLVTIEHLLIPYELRKSGASYTESMSIYGLIHGMVFPIIMFPSCVVYSFSSLIVPEFAGYNEQKRYDTINRAVSICLEYVLIFAIGVAGIFICFSYELSMAFYNSSEAFTYIRLFAPLVVVMYLDAAIDGMLKGLNEQIYSMKINIADALISVILVYSLIPSLGIKGYVIAIFVCEIFNCSMSLSRLIQVCNPQCSITRFIFKPIIKIIISTTSIIYIFDVLNITKLNSVFNLISRIVCVVLLYMLLNFGSSKNIKTKKARNA